MTGCSDVKEIVPNFQGHSSSLTILGNKVEPLPRILRFECVHEKKQKSILCSCWSRFKLNNVTIERLHNRR